MRTTLKDTANAITLRNGFVFAAALTIPIITAIVFDHLIWRRFVIPAIIIIAASIGWRIAQTINQQGLKQVVNAAIVGLFAFAAAIFAGAALDSIVFPETGYFSFLAHSVMWLWIALHLYRALAILRRMSTAEKQLVTESTAVIYAQMTRREERMGEVLNEARRKAATVGVKVAI